MSTEGIIFLNAKTSQMDSLKLSHRQRLIGWLAVCKRHKARAVTDELSWRVRPQNMQPAPMQRSLKWWFYSFPTLSFIVQIFFNLGKFWFHWGNYPSSPIQIRMALLFTLDLVFLCTEKALNYQFCACVFVCVCVYILHTFHMHDNDFQLFQCINSKELGRS